jgi:hypothetical protein
VLGDTTGPFYTGAKYLKKHIRKWLKSKNLSSIEWISSIALFFFTKLKSRIYSHWNAILPSWDMLLKFN